MEDTTPDMYSKCILILCELDNNSHSTLKCIAKFFVITGDIVQQLTLFGFPFASWFHMKLLFVLHFSAQFDSRRESGKKRPNRSVVAYSTRELVFCS